MIDHGENDTIPYPEPTDGERALHEAMMDVIRDMVRQLNERDGLRSVSPKEIETALFDAILGGTGIIRGGKRIDPMEIYCEFNTGIFNERDKKESRHD